MFADRQDAGRRLAKTLANLKLESPIVMAVPRGGVPVGAEVARALAVPMDIIVARKLRAPAQPELGIGAIVNGDHPESVLNPELIAILGVSPEYLRTETERELREIARRQAAYRGGRPATPVVGHTVILVDDGIATGGSIRAALRGLRRLNPRRVVLAVPVAPADTVENLRKEADEVVCLETPEEFSAIGEFYDDFSQTSDEEVVELLAEAYERERSRRRGLPEQTSSPEKR